MSKQLKADIALLFVTVGWGASFLLTKNSLTFLPTFNFLAIRFLIAFILSSIIFIKKMISIDKKTLKYGIILGTILYSVYAFQTIGLNYTSISKSAFITGSNVVLVPIISLLLIKKGPNKKNAISVIIAFIGLALLTINKGISGINVGDMYTFICAVLFAFYIVLVSKYSTNVEPISLAVIQLGIVSLLSLITSIAIENPIIPIRNYTWINIIILSLACTSGAYIVQSIAQKYTSPTHTALIYSGQPVFASIFGYIVLGESLDIKGIIGAILILCGMLIAEIDFKTLLNKKFNTPYL